ncbi:ankyrin repeat domain-containing protein SOWAHA-like [Oppia nitens]|uniref:ankyrin repeat domain-containing protein SOWAHA-like n=1 Tax=Oppia nitens TaxID=1686743 RepID=UPI0023DAA70B|nr:ankyrin repeat domain-containing protein SOWAHA-like [Oppia nitens]
MSLDLGFTLDDIKYYLLSNDGVVEYHELVKAFRHHLSKQNTQIEARKAFADYVNQLAVVSNKQDNKYLVLRPQFRNNLQENVYQSRISSQSPQTQLQPLSQTHPLSHPQPLLHQQQPTLQRHESINSIGLPVSMREPPIGIPVVESRRPQPPKQLNIPQKMPLMVTQPKARVDQTMNNRPIVTAVRQMSFSYPSDSCETPPQPPPRRRNSAASSGKAKTPIEERLKHFDDERNGDKYLGETTADSPSHQIEKLKEIHELSIQTPGRVKERAQKIDKMASLTELKPPMPVQPNINNNVANTRPKSRTGTAKSDKDSEETDSGSMQTLDPLRKKWIISASNCDYNSLVLCLKEEPKLSGYRDFTNGYTALHWASKFAKPDIVKLIAGSYGVNPNMKSHGGYTPLHLAAINQNEDIMELLIKTYNADSSIRDNSGKRPAQYLKHKKTSNTNGVGKPSNGVITSQPNNFGPNLTAIPKSIAARIASESSSSTTNFIRIGSLKAASKVKKITGIGPKSWGSVESIPENNNVNKKSKRNKKNSKRLSTPERHKDSDSDSTYGFQ